MLTGKITGYGLVGLFVLSTACCQAQEMYTDRPDQTEEAKLVKKGVLQVETGILYNRFDTGNNALIVRGVVRYGLAKRLEIGILIEEGKERDRYIEKTVQSTYPLAFRTKIAIVEHHGWIPDITLIGYLQLPFTINRGQGKSHWSPSVLAAFDHELSDTWQLEYNAGFQQEAFSTSIVSLVNASLHHKISAKAELFSGYFAQYQHRQAPFHNIDAGFMYKVKAQIQVDIAVGSSLFQKEPNQFVTLGIAWALDK